MSSSSCHALPGLLFSSFLGVERDATSPPRNLQILHVALVHWCRSTTQRSSKPSSWSEMMPSSSCCRSTTQRSPKPSSLSEIMLSSSCHASPELLFSSFLGDERDATSSPRNLQILHVALVHWCRSTTQRSPKPSSLSEMMRSTKASSLSEIMSVSSRRALPTSVVSSFLRDERDATSSPRNLQILHVALVHWCRSTTQRSPKPSSLSEIMSSSSRCRSTTQRSPKLSSLSEIMSSSSRHALPGLLFSSFLGDERNTTSSPRNLQILHVALVHWCTSMPEWMPPKFFEFGEINRIPGSTGFSKSSEKSSYDSPSDDATPKRWPSVIVGRSPSVKNPLILVSAQRLQFVERYRDPPRV